MNPDELGYYPFAAYLDKCAGSCNASDGPSSRICVLNKPEVVYLNVFNKITGANEQKR